MKGPRLSYAVRHRRIYDESTDTKLLHVRPAGSGCDGDADGQNTKYTFDSDQAPADWAVTGDVAFDVTRGREGSGGSLKVGPGGKALLTLRDRDESGKVEVWVYDDGAAPADPRAHRLGPRWGLVQGDGRLLAVGVLYASYLGGAEGYTATASDGRDWLDQLFWLGIKRAPPGWHKWAFDFEEPVENMPQYGLEYGRVAGICALLLCTDLAPEQKEPLLVNYVQIGIDLGGMIRAGHPGWTGWGGHGSGRKIPIVFAGLLLGDDELAGISGSYPKVSFGEDDQTAYGDCWTGAKVVFAGHSGIDAATGEGRSRGNMWGPYEHAPPSQWGDGPNTSESYRRCCTSVGWVAQALALRLMHAERQSGHDAFFDYVDRWMCEDDAPFVKTIKEATGRDHDKDWARQGQAWDAFVNEMWAKHRPALAAPTDGWKQQHDDAYYRAAIKSSQ